MDPLEGYRQGALRHVYVRDEPAWSSKFTERIQAVEASIAVVAQQADQQLNGNPRGRRSLPSAYRQSKPPLQLWQSKRVSSGIRNQFVVEVHRAPMVS